MLNGRDCQKLLHFVAEHPQKDIEFKTVLIALKELTKYAIAETLDVDSIQKVPSCIARFSRAWRHENLPAINKLHLIEAHLFDFIRMHMSWGIFGEQG